MGINRTLKYKYTLKDSFKIIWGIVYHSNPFRVGFRLICCFVFTLGPLYSIYAFNLSPYIKLALIFSIVYWTILSVNTVNLLLIIPIRGYLKRKKMGEVQLIFDDNKLSMVSKSGKQVSSLDEYEGIQKYHYSFQFLRKDKRGTDQIPMSAFESRQDFEKFISDIIDVIETQDGTTP